MGCLRPEEFDGTTRGTTASFSTSYPRALQRSVTATWPRYGYEPA
jgi:4-hydroxy-3-polyprenylbenzoate decarboxylase